MADKVTKICMDISRKFEKSHRTFTNSYYFRNLLSIWFTMKICQNIYINPGIDFFFFLYHLSLNIQCWHMRLFESSPHWYNLLNTESLLFQFQMLVSILIVCYFSIKGIVSKLAIKFWVCQKCGKMKEMTTNAVKLLQTHSIW
jgi:hypothetical protein